MLWVGGWLIVFIWHGLVAFINWSKKKKGEIDKIRWEHWFNWENFRLLQKIVAVITVIFLISAVLFTELTRA